MKILQILKSEPDEVIKKLMEPISKDNESQQLGIYRGDVDYDKLVELVFEHDKVICWW
jgi:hypothetical protein